MTPTLIQSDALPLLIVGISSGGLCLLIGFITAFLYLRQSH